MQFFRYLVADGWRSLAVSGVRLVAAAAALAQLSACARTISWVEEVALNNGAVLQVHRTATYSLGGDAGNPLDVGWRPDRTEIIEFDWQSKHYRYEGDALPFVLAISPEQKPVLVAPASFNSWWAAHGYACTIPFYVELIPTVDRRTWTWPPQIEPWLHGLPKNLMLARDLRHRKLGTYSAAQVRQIDGPAVAGRPALQQVDPTYVGDACRNTKRK